jgi:hypothetical protein
MRGHPVTGVLKLQLPCVQTTAQGGHQPQDACTVMEVACAKTRMDEPHSRAGAEVDTDQGDGTARLGEKTGLRRVVGFPRVKSARHTKKILFDTKIRHPKTVRQAAQPRVEV